MPVFFVVSGYFASRAMARPWRASAVRLATNYWLYLVWLLAYFAFFSWETVLPSNRTHGLHELWMDVLWASTSMWFMYAIVVYYVVIRATMWVPAWAVIGAATVWTWFVSDLGLEFHNRESTLLYLAWFALGARAPEVVSAVVRHRIPVLVTLASFVAASVGLQELSLSRSHEVVIGGLVGVPAMLLLSVRLQGTGFGRRVAKWLGDETLPIYVMHLMFLALLLHAPFVYGDGDHVPAAVAAVLPLLVALGLIAACLLTHRVLIRIGGRYLFELPAPLVRVLAPPRGNVASH